SQRAALEIAAEEEPISGVREDDPSISQLHHVAELGKRDRQLALQREGASAWLRVGAASSRSEREAGQPPGSHHRHHDTPGETSWGTATCSALTCPLSDSIANATPGAAARIRLKPGKRISRTRCPSRSTTCQLPTESNAARLFSSQTNPSAEVKPDTKGGLIAEKGSC